MVDTSRYITGKLELITKKDWKLAEFVEEVKSLDELIKMGNLEGSELYKAYKAFLFNEIAIYMNTKIKGTK